MDNRTDRQVAGLRKLPANTLDLLFPVSQPVEPLDLLFPTRARH